MVGGKIIGLTIKGDETHVHVADCPHHPKHSDCQKPDTCCVWTDAKRIDNGQKVECRSAIRSGGSVAFATGLQRQTRTATIG
jgi:hypothetical protein